MRWPWQRKSEPPDQAEIEEQASASEKVLRRAFDTLRASTKEGIDSAERRIVTEYDRADQERRR